MKSEAAATVFQAAANSFMIEFFKFQGFGNDYLVVSAAELGGIDPHEFAKKICGRNYGAGGDGIALWRKSDDDTADFEVRIINPDGSEAGFSGNGTRCAVAYFYYAKFWDKESLKLSTPSGIKTYTLIEETANGQYRFNAEIGRPKFKSIDIPMELEEHLEAVIDLPLSTSQTDVEITAVNVGNPVCVIFVEEFAGLDWPLIGAEIESHKFFPERTNVVFVRITDRENIDIRIWERGAGETSSSGTCSVAAAVASAETNKTGRNVNVHAPGGTTEVIWRDDDEMILKGRADLVYRGEFNFGAPNLFGS